MCQFPPMMIKVVFSHQTYGPYGDVVDFLMTITTYISGIWSGYTGDTKAQWFHRSKVLTQKPRKCPATVEIIRLKLIVFLGGCTQEFLGR